MLDQLLRTREILAAREEIQRSSDRERVEKARREVQTAEATVKADPAGSLTFDGEGRATLTAGDRAYHAGRFAVLSLGALKRRVLAMRREEPPGEHISLSVLQGADPLTDIGALQGTTQEDTLFQVASQFNCLESPGPFVTEVARYFSDPTQGPRASISTFPGALLRHYAAPGKDGARFVQTEAHQLDLLAGVCDPGVAKVRSGYLTGSDILQPDTLTSALVSRFEEISVGVHEDVEVVFGYQWGGPVTGSRRISQVFTSTFAGGGYSQTPIQGAIEVICRQLLRAAYLGTLLAAVALGKRKVLLTLIGGGVFGNPIRLIWEAILWALEETESLTSHPLDVVLNLRTPPGELHETELTAQVRRRGGIFLSFDGGSFSVSL